jgi:hypothetical protein
VEISRRRFGTTYWYHLWYSSGCFCRRFGTIYRSHLRGLSVNFLPTFRDNLLVQIRGSSRNFLQTFRDNLSVPSLGFKWKFLAYVLGQPIGPVLGVQVVIYYRCFGTIYWSHPWGSSGNFLLTFRDNLSVPIVMVQELETWGWERCCPETSVWKYHYSLLNNPEQRSSQLLRGVNLKSRSYTRMSTTHRMARKSLDTRHVKQNTCTSAWYGERHLYEISWRWKDITKQTNKIK